MHSNSPHFTLVRFRFLAPLIVVAPLLLGGLELQARDVDASELGASVALPWDSALPGPAVARGDFNQDGFHDLLIPLPGVDQGLSRDVGLVALLLGPLELHEPYVSIETLQPLMLSGTEPLSLFGSSIAGAADLNRDGLHDFAILAPGEGVGGRLFLFFGRLTLTPGTSLTPDVTLEAGSDTPLEGGQVVFPGDLDGDGWEDLLLSAPKAVNTGPHGQTTGRLYIFYGTSNWLERTFSNVDAVLRADGRGDDFGSCVIGASDITGDGLPDVAIGAPGKDTLATDAGAVYLLSGGPRLSGSAPAALAVLTQVQGDSAGDGLGTYLSAGDATGDGLSDLLLASPGKDLEAPLAGRVYLLPGRRGSWPASSTSVGSYATASFIGESPGNGLGLGLGPMVDMNADGHADLVLGAPFAGTEVPEAGTLYVFLGPSSRWSAATAAAAADLKVSGVAASDALGILSVDSLSSEASPLTLFVTAQGQDAGSFDGGAVYLVPVALHLDVDEDGFAPLEGDCDDTLPQVWPGSPELCDDLDNDCDGERDEGLTVYSFYLDADGDGFGVGSPIAACGSLPGNALQPGDCDDTNSDVYPAAVEACDGVDTDCDGELSPEERDPDGDGFTLCGWPSFESDCQPTLETVYPGAEEICDGLDSDCDLKLPSSELDEDLDGYLRCEGDCNDARGTIYPGAEEACDGFDTDCDGSIQVLEVDQDGDGISSCRGDCDETDASVYPGALEACDGLDTNCDGNLPPEEVDSDSDGALTCGEVADCDDTDPLIYPGASEICDGKDSDCDSILPAEEKDSDADGFTACEGDCAPEQYEDHPGALERCDGRDNDCDSSIDESLEVFLCLRDQDGDGYGDLEATLESCDCPSGYVLEGGDCDDRDPMSSPGVTLDLMDGEDNDCDGEVDEDAALVETPEPPTPTPPASSPTVLPSEPPFSETPEVSPTPPETPQGCACAAEHGSGSSLLEIAPLALWLWGRRRRPGREPGRRPGREPGRRLGAD